MLQDCRVQCAHDVCSVCANDADHVREILRVVSQKELFAQRSQMTMTLTYVSFVIGEAPSQPFVIYL